MARQRRRLRDDLARDDLLPAIFVDPPTRPDPPAQKKSESDGRVVQPGDRPPAGKPVHESEQAR